jgi:hypothetical protein
VAFAVGLAGRGVPPVELTPTRLDFGSVPVGAPMAGSPARKFTARNNRTTPIAPLDVRISGEHPQEFSTGDDSCAGTAVAPLASCSFQVSFRPARVGAKTALLEVSGTDVKVTAVLLGAGGPAAP